jgi:peptidoglycan/xylan/chitin deacetylase (PgdA/CDA1 family)
MNEGNSRPVAPVGMRSTRATAGMRAVSVGWICAAAIFTVACIGAPSLPVAAGVVGASPLAVGGEPHVTAVAAPLPSGEPRVFATAPRSELAAPASEAGDAPASETEAAGETEMTDQNPPTGSEAPPGLAGAAVALLPHTGAASTVPAQSTQPVDVVAPAKDAPAEAAPAKDAPAKDAPAEDAPAEAAMSESAAAAENAPGDAAADVAEVADAGGAAVLPIEAALELPVPAPSAIAPSLPAQQIDAPAAASASPALPARLESFTPDGVERSIRVPVLMYHYLSVPPANADIYRKDLSVAPDLFAAHLDRLAAEGYTTITPAMFIAALQQGAPLPEKPVLLTFDDGYRDNFENAFPALRDRNMVATFFVVTDFLDEERPEYLTWEMAREMLAAGMSIESHGRNHATLRGRDSDYLVWQALGSLETIAYELGVRPHFVSYPAGEYDANTISLFASADYWAGFTTQQRATHSSANPFELGRVRVRGTTSPDDLVRLLNVDW